jgi:hypothetical protein
MPPSHFDITSTPFHQFLTQDTKLKMASNITPSSPIVFKARGMNPDVCLEVFGTKFHVHSVVLKLHSHFFYTFFDSADKNNTGSGGTFKYEWVTKVVDDGKDWQLVCKGPKVSSFPTLLENVTQF